MQQVRRGREKERIEEGGTDREAPPPTPPPALDEPDIEEEIEGAIIHLPGLPVEEPVVEVRPPPPPAAAAESPKK